MTARRPTEEVRIGAVGVGGSNPIRIQSMTTANTLDVAATAAEARRMIAAGCEIVRITAQTTKEARALGEIKKILRADGFDAPLVADIHFSPPAALEAAKWVEKVRVNPGNFADSKQFRHTDLSNAEYDAELARVAEKFRPLVRFCKTHGVAMRIGTNHGSLSDRLLSRYGDTPLGMVESALEFARIARDEGYRAIVFSMKSSNPRVMAAAYRLLVRRLEEEKMPYPLHLGVTEAGDGEDARVKSAIGIGTLLAEGIGDTIRVSLAEDPVNEIPVARELARVAEALRGPGWAAPHGPEEAVKRRVSRAVEIAGLRIGGEAPPRVGVVLRGDETELPAAGPDEICEVRVLDAAPPAAAFPTIGPGDARLHEVAEDLHRSRAAAREDDARPIVLRFRRQANEDDATAALRAGILLGGPLCEGIGDLVIVEDRADPARGLHLAYAVLQNSGARITRTDYVACPSCGRTLFDLVETTAKVKAVTNHLKDVRIAVMGCIVNGPGEMADADFGFVGGAPGLVNLYVGKNCVVKGVPMETAPAALVDLIKSSDKWVEPAASAAT